MKIIIFGASGMVGQGALRECLADPRVTKVLAVGRSEVPQQNEKLTNLVVPRLEDLSAFTGQLSGYDACFYCLGVSASGLTEAEYRRINFDLTLSVAQFLTPLNPGLAFLYVSGTGTDSTERGGVMWARVKGTTENALLRLPFKAAYMLRPGIIRPLHGIKSKTKIYRVLYTWTGPLLWLLGRLWPGIVITTEQLGRAMIVIAHKGAPKTILENRDIRKLQLP